MLLAWALEMWGYGLLGIATWLVAPVFGGDRLERVTAGLFVANGVVGVVGAVWTAVSPGWVMMLPGLVAFAAWNVLVFVMSALTIAVLRRRGRGADASPGRSGADSADTGA